jgi:ubiquinone/menaquinone biosynthesis C-methylase UbiE
MPDLNTPLHLDMLRIWKKENSFLRRVRRAAREIVSPNLYGLEWGDPEVSPPQIFVRDHYVLPYVRPDHVALEIGPGGGRWTRYLLGFRQLYVVDYHPEMLRQLRRRVDRANMRFIANNGTDFPGVPTASVDFVLTLACFVHLDAELISAYLKSIASVLKPGGNVVVGYSDKTKIGARTNPTFSETTPALMREMVVQKGFQILEEDLTTLWNSSIIRFTQKKLAS